LNQDNDFSWLIALKVLPFAQEKFCDLLF